MRETADWTSPTVRYSKKAKFSMTKREKSTCADIAAGETSSLLGSKSTWVIILSRRRWRFLDRLSLRTSIKRCSLAVKGPVVAPRVSLTMSRWYWKADWMALTYSRSRTVSCLPWRARCSWKASSEMRGTGDVSSVIMVTPVSLGWTNPWRLMLPRISVARSAWPSSVARAILVSWARNLCVVALATSSWFVPPMTVSSRFLAATAPAVNCDMLAADDTSDRISSE